MDWPAIIYAIAALASAAAAAMAWGAKLQWSKEFAAAKNAQIETLEREIESLKFLTPMKIREYYESSVTQLEEYIDKLQRELGASKRARSGLEASGHEKAGEGRELKKRIMELELTLAESNRKLSAHKSAATVTALLSMDKVVLPSVLPVPIFHTDDLGFGTDPGEGDAYRPAEDEGPKNKS